MDKLVKSLTHLAARHVRYKTLPEHYYAVGDTLVSTLGKALGNKCDAETKDAWVHVYSLMCKVMIPVTFEDAKATGHVSKDDTNWQKYMPSFCVNEPKLDEVRVKRIRDSWDLIRSGQAEGIKEEIKRFGEVDETPEDPIDPALAAFGRLFYGSMFSKYPEVRPLFPQDMKTQAKKLTRTLDQTVATAEKALKAQLQPAESKPQLKMTIPADLNGSTGEQKINTFA